MLKHINIKHFNIILLFIVIGGCNKTHQSSKIIPTIHELELIPLVDIPPNCSLIGHVDFNKTLFLVPSQPIKVYIKASRNESWIEIEALQKDQATYTYDQVTHQLRFQWCEDGWAYAIMQ